MDINMMIVRSFFKVDWKFPNDPEMVVAHIEKKKSISDFP
jgi:hypothetical protein